MDKTNVWKQVLEKIKSDVSNVTFNSYFKNTELYELNLKEAKVLCKHGELQKNAIEKRHSDIVLAYLKEVSGNDLDLYFITKDDIKNIEENEVKEDPNIIVQNPEKHLRTTYNSNLNKSKTFDNFVVGESNQLATNTAMMVAKNPGQSYNPFFLYGNSGVGKTHLMHAIGNYIEDHSNLRVLYISCDQFITDFTDMTRKNKANYSPEEVEFFKNKYRNVDVLMIDDIQSLGNTKTTQEEFFNTFNELHDNNKQIVISSDSSPNDLKKLEDRLKTRFEWGMSSDIKPPEYELRKRIVEAKLKGENINTFDEDSIEYIAKNITGNVRSLEGAINRVLMTSLIYENLDLDITIEALKDLVGKGGTGLKNDINYIQKLVADYYRISIDEMISKRRSKNILLPRQIAIYLCCKHTNESLSKIGLEFSQTHSTVINSKNKIEKNLKTNNELKRVIKTLETDIKKML